jgi:hypothetical protein
VSVHTRGVVLVGSSEGDLRTAADQLREMRPSPGGITLQTPAEFDAQDPASRLVIWVDADADADASADADADGSSLAAVGEPDPAPLILVCTHGKHDACCALRGRPVAAALDACRPGRVWECSHIGGDRFAANALVLPAGLVYGQVPAAAAPEFMDALDADEVVGGLLRGRIGMPPVAQAALAFAYEHLALRARNALAIESVDGPQDGVARVTVRGPHARHVVQVRIELVYADGLTCAQSGPGRFTRYRPISVTAA